MKKHNPSSGQNGQLVHWWLLVHSGPYDVHKPWGEPKYMGGLGLGRAKMN
jgi:hypothetical protein